MITAFLFTYKLINDKTIHWVTFYKKRFYRLYPIYFVVIIALFFIVAYLSNFTLFISYFDLLKQITHWLLFTFFSITPINNIKNTALIIAGVSWTLTYEILFYLCVPLLGMLVFKQKFNYWVFFLCCFILSVFCLKANTIEYNLLWNFFYGFIIAIVSPYLKSYFNFKKNYFSVLALLLLGINIYLYENSNHFKALFLQAVVFLCIVNGNSFWGILNRSFSQILGQISYSVYLIHGIFMFITYPFIIPESVLIQLTLNQYFMLGFFHSAVVVFFALLSYKYIEKPFICGRIN